MSELYPPTFTDYFLLDPPLLADPYPLYARMRASDPVQWENDMNMWVLTGYAEVSAGLRDARFSVDRVPDGSQFPPEMAPYQATFAFISRQMLFRDAPDHTRLRGLVSKAFTPRMIATMRASIQQIVDDLLDQAQAQGQMDVIRDLAYPLPTTVIAGMLGIPQADRDQFKRWSDDFAAFLGTAETTAMDGMMRSIDELVAYFRAHIPTRTGNEQDLLAALLAAEEQGDVLSETELFANIILLLAAGHETTTNLIGNGLYALLRHPQHLQPLRDDPTLMPAAVEEFLRYDSPVQFTSRIATTEMTLGQHTIQAGQEALFSLGAANRDPAQFAEPDVLDVTRRDNKHVAFGFGAHFCLGAPLARLEAQIAFATLLQRFPALHLLDETPPYLPNAAFHGLQTLPVGW
jgi:cytochrome P450